MIILHAIGQHFLIAFWEGWEVEVFLNRGDPLMFLSPYFGHLVGVGILSPFSIQVLRLLSKKRIGVATHLPPHHPYTLSQFISIPCQGLNFVWRNAIVSIDNGSSPPHVIQHPSSKMTLNYWMIVVGDSIPGHEIFFLFDRKLAK